MVAAVEVGRDFLSDADPLQVGRILEGLLGQRFMQTLDEQIAIGDGSQEPEGIFTASGLGSVSSTNGTSGSLVYTDALNMVFGLSKQYRTPQMAPVFVGPDTIFSNSKRLRQALRAIPERSTAKT